MTTARCPACGAALAEGAPWCTLCYTDLRAPAVPEAAPAAAPSSGPRHAASSRPRHAASAAPTVATPASSATRPSQAQGSSVDLLDPLLDPLLDSPVTTAAGAARGPAFWPCLACGASNGLEHDACTQCGTAFLAGAEPEPVIDIPLIGSLRPLSAAQGSRAWVMVGGGLLVCVILVALLSIVGLFL